VTLPIKKNAVWWFHQFLAVAADDSNICLGQGEGKMKRFQAIVIVIGLSLGVLAITLGGLVTNPAQAAPPFRPLYAPGDCMVSTTADSGPGSLRQCMSELQPGATITFSPTVFSLANPAMITLTSALPEIITDNVTIDGSGVGVILEGSGTPDGSGGLVIDGASHVVIKGLQILNFPFVGIELRNGASNNTIGGINSTPGNACNGDCNLISGNSGGGFRIFGSGTTSNTVSGNYIGTDISGTAAISNGDIGVSIFAGATYNLIGGDTPGERNLISGNDSDGVLIADSGTMSNVLSGNYIGTDTSGILSIPNTRIGVFICSGADHNIIGGSNATPGGVCSGECNLISGNTGSGIQIDFEGTLSPSMENTISGNYIGTDVSGTAAIPNGDFGVNLEGGAKLTVVGGNSPDKRNLISGNSRLRQLALAGSGVMSNTISGNFIGTDASGTAAMGNIGAGIWIGNGASHNLIGGHNTVLGGNCTGECNLISGNDGDGISINGSDTLSNTVSGNYIGTNLAGTAAISNSNRGVSISDGAQYTLVGGANATPGGICSGACNLISGNNKDGVRIFGDGTMNNMVSGNYIGTNGSGTTAVGNGLWYGVLVDSSATFNLIGGDTPGERNLISGNEGNGVAIVDYAMSNTVSGNYIGTNVDGTTAIPNAQIGVFIETGANHNLIGGENATPGGDCSGECNLISGNLLRGVQIDFEGTANNSTNNTISGNYIGTDVSGTSAVPNTHTGVRIEGGAELNVIGGDTPGERNLISGNDDFSQLAMDGSGTVNNTISGNYIGTDSSGTVAITNTGNGIWIGNGASHNLIGGNNATPGGNCSGECNLISGNDGDGISIHGSDTLSNTISGNYIGTDKSGSVSLGNGGNGVGIDPGTWYSLVGGDSPAERNLISSNSASGIWMWGDTAENVVSGNYIGTDATGNGALANNFAGVNIADGANKNIIGGSTIAEGNVIAYNGVYGIIVVGADTLNNTFTHNSIHSNVTRGIELADGGNLELFPPIPSDVTTNSVSGIAPPGSTVEIFSDDGDQARYFHGAILADASSHFTFTQAIPFTGANVAVIATDSDGNTSTFSAPSEPLVDIRVTAILQPKSSGRTNQPITPTVKIGNAGTTAETGINVSVVATGPARSGPYAPPAQVVNLSPLSLATLTFPPFTPTVVADYMITATVTLAGDETPSNDVQTRRITVLSDVIDLWTQDNETDTGDISAYPFWESPDIWVCHNDNEGCTEHQDPIAGQANFVYVRVRNRGNAASDGADIAKIYWHQPSLAIKCGSWAPIATEIIHSSAANTGTQLLKFSWTPTQTGHTCLLSEIISEGDPIINPCDVPWDNNISQRNVNIVSTGSGLRAQVADSITFEVSNIKDAPRAVAIILDVSKVPDANAVQLDLGSDLAARWASVNGIAKSSGIAWHGGSIITVTNLISGTIASIPMADGETQTVTLSVNTPSVGQTSVTVYEAIDAGSGIPLIDAIVGGNTYVFSAETSDIYLPVILKH
jgi:hypothetical protein